MTVTERVIGGPQPDGREWDFQCARCGSSAEVVECEMCCGEGVDGHDCGEDCCMCIDPEPNMRCDYCQGRCHWTVCMSSAQWCFENPRLGREQIASGTPEWYTFEAKSLRDGERRGA